jgi:hypothetical protein
MAETIPPNCMESYNRLVEESALFERKGKTTPYTSLNGHMSSFLAKDGSMGIRLSPEDRESFISTYNSRLMEQHGRIMKDFVYVSSELIHQTNDLLPFMQKSHDYIATLKPKPSKKKK